MDIETTIEEKKDRGFTLVELLIVIIILGILAAVTIFAVRGITDRGAQNACQSEKRTVETAVEAYYAVNSVNPTALTDLTGGASPLLKNDPKYWTVGAGGAVSAVGTLPTGCT